jgi:hypothetical protein
MFGIGRNENFLSGTDVGLDPCRKTYYETETNSANFSCAYILLICYLPITVASEA